MIRARKRFGQHFLEPVWVEKVIKAIAPQAEQDFVEIGPGPGALTRPLTQRAKSVTAFEIDRDLAAALGWLRCHVGPANSAPEEWFAREEEGAEARPGGRSSWSEV